MKVRTERDSMGEIDVPADALYAAQTQRAVDNFTISQLKVPVQTLAALSMIKEAAAEANGQLGLLSSDRVSAITRSARMVREKSLWQHFPVDLFQTGSGTSSNMNMNEVIAHLCDQEFGVEVHANDDVNMGQSSNDVVPTAISVSAYLLTEQQLLPTLKHLASVIDDKGQSLSDVCKTGRTHLMDAMPLTFAQELSGWHAQIQQNIYRIEQMMPSLAELAQGGTAVGTGINSSPQFGAQFATALSNITGAEFTPCENYFYAQSSQDTIVAFSGGLRTTAVSLMKIANDLRLMNSGPLAGLGEIALPALQPGSSIMPGKVNPVIPEAVCMVAAQVMGNDQTIAIAGQSGNFQLNVMLPVIAHNIIESIDILSGASAALADKAISGFKVNHDNIDAALAKNPILVTALNPIVGYSKAAEIAKKAYEDKRPIVDVAAEHTDLDRSRLEALLDPMALTRPQSDSSE